MGVPKFYRWISERYPKINQVITDSALLPEFDHLYLDMNGIIHGCTHPNHLDVSEVLSERDMMLGIMHYIDRIITQIVKPKVSVYMAIDGVAPRAKLNQQRSRRFRSAKDLAEATKDKDLFSSVTSGDENGDSPYNGAFDSNCITPGTEFMARVSSAIKYFIRKKIKEDPLWRNLKVIFSGHEIPGEGEHKIMQHIRDMKNQPGYQPNSRHCMYGQDADLIMLGLVSHEPHFTLLREIVDFNFKQNKNALKSVKKFTKQSDFQLLHLSILREYLEIEFAYEADKESYNLEAIIDDFVFMTFLVGNDFLPHMPSLDIGDNAFDLLFNVYKEQRHTWGKGQYLTNAGHISDPARLEAFISVVGAAENEILEKREKDEAEYRKKRRRWDKMDGKPEGQTEEQLAVEKQLKQDEYMLMIEKIMADGSEETQFVDGWRLSGGTDEKDFKGRYYFEKLNFTPIDVKKHQALRKSYIEGLQWCLAYYYQGCISWGWFYPFHYGPMLSDLTGLPEMFKSIKFEIGAPLKPFEQLMGCLPPASSALVPRPYRKLMCSPSSPIANFYPTDFKVDMNGKRNPWEGVNLLPFIDVQQLKDVIAEHCPNKVLTAEERSRNSIGNVLCFTHDLTANETVPSFNRDIGLPDITKCNSRVVVLEEPNRSNFSFKPELIPGTKIPYPGFPSLNVLPIDSVELNGIGLNCFGTASKYATTVLSLHKLPQLPGAAQLAENILGKSVFVNWPMMHEAKVVAVSDATCEVRNVKKKRTIKTFTPEQSEKWIAESITVAQQYLTGFGVPGSGGVNIGEIQICLKLLPLQGMKTMPSDGSTKKLFGSEEASVPLQMALFNAPAPDPRFVERGPMKLRDRFPPGCNIVLTKGKYRGCSGTVLGVAAGKKLGVKVKVVPPEPPFGLAIARSVNESYVSLIEAAKVLQLNPGVLGKVTGSLCFDPGRYDLGLNLKFKSNYYVLGYTRKKSQQNVGRNHRNNPQNGANKKHNAWETGDSLLVVGSRRTTDSEEGEEGNRERVIWEYTPKAIRLVAAYRQKFPQLFAAINKNPNERSYDARTLFGPQGELMLPKIREWLNSIETAKMPRTPCSTVAMPVPAVQAVQRAADVRSVALQKLGPPKEVNIRVPPIALYREGSTSATDVMLSSHYNEGPPELGDRIVNFCANGIPFGARGTVVSVHDPTTGCVEVVMDEEFIGGSSLQGVCANFRGKLCVWSHLLRISALTTNKEKFDQPYVATTPEKSSIGNPDSGTKVANAWNGNAVDTVREKTSEIGVAETFDNGPVVSQNLPITGGNKINSTSQQVINSSTTGKASVGRPREFVRKVAAAEDVEEDNIVLVAGKDNSPNNHSSLPAYSSNGAPTSGRNQFKLSPSAKSFEVKKTNSDHALRSQQNPTTRGGKQGFWKEALGPRGKLIGFKGAGRGSLSGYKKWQKLVCSNGPTGLPNNRAPKKFQKNYNKKGGSSDHNKSSSASAGLKAILGVKESHNSEQQRQPAAPKVPTTPSNDASSGLKAILGVGVSKEPTLDPPPVKPSVMQHVYPPAPASMPPNTTNNDVMEMMMKHLPSSPTKPTPQQPPSGPVFNFTYVQEGQKSALPPQHQTHYQNPQILPPHHMAETSHYGGYGHTAPSPNAMPEMSYPGGFARYYPMTGPPVAPYNPVLPVIPRQKRLNKSGSNVSDGSAKIVPSVVIAKSRK